MKTSVDGVLSGEEEHMATISVPTEKGKKMYRSPVEVLTTDIKYQIDKGIDEEIYKAVVSVGIIVDKEELLLALRQDRGQYEKGFADAQRSIVRCEDCEKWEEVYGGGMTRKFGLCKECRLATPRDHFCSYGVLKSIPIPAPPMEG